MIAIRHKLHELTHWLQLNRLQIQEYIMHYPFVQFKQMQASNHLKNKIGQVISLVASEIVPPSTINTSTEKLYSNLNEYATQINNLSDIKRHLDQIKCAFLGLDNLKRFNTTVILGIIQQSIKLTNVNPKSKQLNEPFHYSFETTMLTDHKKIYQEKLKYWTQQYRNLNQNDKNIKIRAELHAQMNEFLDKKEKDLKQKRQKKSLSHYFGSKEKGLQISQISIKKKEQKQRKRIFPITQQTLKYKKYTNSVQDYKSYSKRKYKYLQDLEELEFKTNQRPAIFEAQQSPTNKYDIKLPSTSDSNKNQQISQLQIELSKFQTEKELQSSIVMELNFDLLLSTIRQQKHDVVVGEDWQSLDQDSIDGSKQVCNLQDSLQMMKAGQVLDNTGYFGIKQSKIIASQNHQYSFSNQ